MKRMLDAFYSKDWEVRSNAFYHLLKLASGDADIGVNVSADLASLLHVSGEADRIRRALNSLLLEEDLYAKKQDRLSEGYLDYYGDLVWAVSSLHDPESLDSLLGAITTGDMAMSAIAGLGSPAIRRTLELLDMNDVFVRESATGVLSEMVELKNTQQEMFGVHDQGEIKQGLLKAAADVSPYVRIVAVDGLVQLGDEDCIRVLYELSNNDPAEASEIGREVGYYPVREAAKDALLRLSHGAHGEGKHQKNN